MSDTYGDYQEHPAAGAFPLMDDLTVRELANDIRKNGQRHPVIVSGMQIIDGRNRMRACKIAQVDPRIVDKPFDSEDELLRYVVSENMMRRHMSESQRAMAGSALAKLRRGRQSGNVAGLTQKQAANTLGVSERSVRTARTIQDHGIPELVAEVEAGRVNVSTAARIANLAPAEQEKICAGGTTAIIEKSRDIKRKTTAMASGNSMSTVEWFTPGELVEDSRELLKGIALDPASCEEANEVVKANTFYDVAADGLSMEWAGTVFLNPPFDDTATWSAKLIESSQLGLVAGAVFVCNANVSTRWFQGLLESATAVCLCRLRIRFNEQAAAEGDRSSPRHNSAVFYFGEDIREFGRLFGKWGFCVGLNGPRIWHGTYE